MRVATPRLLGTIATVTQRPMSAAASSRAGGTHIRAPGNHAEVVDEHQPGGPGDREHEPIVSIRAAGGPPGCCPHGVIRTPSTGLACSSELHHIDSVRCPPPWTLRTHDRTCIRYPSPPALSPRRRRVVAAQPVAALSLQSPSRHEPDPHAPGRRDRRRSRDDPPAACAVETRARCGGPAAARARSLVGLDPARATSSVGRALPDRAPHGDGDGRVAASRPAQARAVRSWDILSGIRCGGCPGRPCAWAP